MINLLTNVILFVFLARNLGMGSGISLIPTSSPASSMYGNILDEPKSKRGRMSSSQVGHKIKL